MAGKKAAPATQLEQVEVVKEVEVTFWQTTYGILLKRLFFQALAVVATTLYDQLTGGGINWAAVQTVLATQLLYVVMTFSRDVVDPKLPNTTKSVVVE